MALLMLLIIVCTFNKAYFLENTTEAITTEQTTKSNYLSDKQICLLESKLDQQKYKEIYYSRIVVSPYENIDYNNYLSCFWKRKDLQKDNGEINFSELEKVLNYVVKIASDNTNIPLLNGLIIAQEILEGCMRIRANNSEMATKMRNCLFGKLLEQRNSQTNWWDDFEDIPYLEVVEEDCVNELNLDGFEIEDLNRYYIVPENISEFNEFLGCAWRKYDLIDVDGNFNKTNLLEYFHQAVRKEILARSRSTYLTDVITKSIINGAKEINGSNDGEVTVKVRNYILRRLPYFAVAQETY